MSTAKSKTALGWLATAVSWLVRVFVLKRVVETAYDIRLFAIKSYGLVIHEFDPWFNFRATQYLADNGLKRFFQWYDYMSWYPLGRPVGTTIYPGMQMTSVFIWHALNDYFGVKMSLNDVCCYVPAWFGAIATVFLGLLTYECTGSVNGAVIASGIMAVIPAHIMRSVGGGYDNESVAMTAMMMTFYLWNASIGASTPLRKFVAVLAGFAYVFMVAAWGGYIFVINMVGLHAAALVVLGYFNDHTYMCYTLFYAIGTFGAVQVPVVGWTPLKSLEQLAPLAVFLGYQVLYACEVERRWKKAKTWSTVAWQIRFRNFSIAAGAVAMVVALLFPTGYFGPLSSRVRGLFVKHTRTGNPLVDSVAEHQPANEQAYKTYLHHTYLIAPYGWALALVWARPAARFLIIWAAVVFFFANKMMRLVLLTGPVTSALSGLVIGSTLDWCLSQWLEGWPFKGAVEEKGAAEDAKDDSTKKAAKKGAKPPKTGKAGAAASTSSSDDTFGELEKMKTFLHEKFMSVYDQKPVKLVRKVLSVGIFSWLALASQSYGKEFYKYSYEMAEQLSSPSIMFHGQLRDGTMITVDDYREAYWWLRDNTPQDSRVMAWWDYGYQIAGIANRTTIADGNTWNHEHIATLGRCLTSPEKKAHNIVKHLADYVLIWTGGGGDDLAKSPHMARIGNSVFNDICPGDPTCSQFGFYQGGQPTPMMAESLLFKLHSHMMRPGIQADPNLFKEVYRSRYHKVRIFQVMGVNKKSKAWIANATNRICDAPGSWYCTGQYPPALKKLIARRKNFAQLEDFNSGSKNEEYHKEYMARMAGEKRGGEKPGYSDGSGSKKKRAKDKAPPPEPKKAKKSSAPDDEGPKIRKRSKKWAEARPWANTDNTNMLYSLIEGNEIDALEEMVSTNPDVIHSRSEDGRGPLWWAYEFQRSGVIDLLMKYKIRTDLTDADGRLPNE